MLKKVLTFCIGSILALLFLSPVAALYSYDGAHRTNPSGATDVKWYPHQWKGTMSEGVSFMRLDSDGFNNTFDYTGQDIDILLMGSSHMEAFQVSKNQSTAALLGKYLPDDTTYNIGIASHTIYHCVDNLDAALTYYQPAQFVILETLDVSLDPAQMQAATAHTRTPAKSSVGGSYYLTRYLPGLNTILQKLRHWKNASSLGQRGSSDFVAEPASVTEPDTPDDIQPALQNFLQYAANITEKHGCRMIIFYHPQPRLTESGSVQYDTNPDDLMAFQSACEKNGIVFVDMTADFTALYNNEHRLPTGFTNAPVGEGHLNRYGHACVAKRLADVILTAAAPQ